jgi:hypothetical protein
MGANLVNSLLQILVCADLGKNGEKLMRNPQIREQNSCLKVSELSKGFNGVDLQSCIAKFYLEGQILCFNGRCRIWTNLVS